MINVAMILSANMAWLGHTEWTGGILHILSEFPGGPRAAVGAIGVASIVIILAVIELVAGYKARTALHGVETQREETLKALDNLYNTATDVIEVPEGSQKRISQAILLLFEAETRTSLAEAAVQGYGIVQSLPYDQEAYQSLEGSWALENDAEIAEEEFRELVRTAESHANAVSIVNFAWWNLPAQVFHRILFGLYTPRGVAGRLRPAPEGAFSSVNISTDVDSEAGDYLINVDDTIITAEETPATTSSGQEEQEETLVEQDFEDIDWVEAQEDPSTS